MESEDFPRLPPSSSSGHGIENNGKVPEILSGGLHENMKALMTTATEEDANKDTPAKLNNFELNGSVEVNAMTSVASVNAENGSLAVPSEIFLGNDRENGTLPNSQEIDAGRISGVKRPRITVNEQEPSVHVIFKSLNRESKRKLEELLQQWSRWHTQSCSESNDSNAVLVSGEEIYYPALHIGLDKSSAVTFWVDNQTKIQSNKEFEPLDGSSVPFYDRGYSLALTSGEGPNSADGVEKLDTSRCFNCGSYSHGLKDCPKPRDNVAVSNARKENKFRRIQHANSRNSTRYYQSTRGGKFEGLMPGVLDPETRQALGLEELDPPPWLHRMREIGYPPGYLEPDVEDQPSGITIFGEETNKEDGEEGEILDESLSEPTKKMSVEYPGINAAIPENADERLWSAGFSNFNLSRSRSPWRNNHSSESLSRENHEPRSRWPISDNVSRGHHEPRWPTSDNVSRGHRGSRWSVNTGDDDGPPGCDSGTSPSLSNHFRRHGEYQSSSYTSHSPWAGPSVLLSPNSGRSLLDRGKSSPSVQNDSPNDGQFGTFPYSSPR